jgi:hypothetical protein
MPFVCGKGSVCRSDSNKTMGRPLPYTVTASLFEIFSLGQACGSVRHENSDVSCGEVLNWLILLQVLGNLLLVSGIRIVEQERRLGCARGALCAGTGKHQPKYFESSRAFSHLQPWKRLQ